MHLELTSLSSSRHCLELAHVWHADHPRAGVQLEALWTIWWHSSADGPCLARASMLVQTGTASGNGLEFVGEAVDHGLEHSIAAVL
ncbi:UNVERIFIED_CONTAM: hypothetical protein Sangu_1698800 [Sesamum angustifolium]|uniref:Uncharacterized protein n=1 Tax=Sesamum angustifolium TaxID=2727405 RepID=A0AAW2MKU5_9LAMI